MALFCTYEATFISIKQPKQEPRSKSAGANVPRQPCPDRSYVESLEERASALAFLESERSEQSEGSAGHPELCFKPCLYLAYGSGACPRRSSCSFCHLPHPKRAKLRRADRELLRQLGEADLLALVLPHLRAKSLGAKILLRVEKIPGADRVLGLMEAHLASLPASNALIAGVGKLAGRLARLSFGQLMHLSRGPGVPGVQAAFAALRSEEPVVQK
ncbi:unnamed protein product [Effrenium voratum]|uniref:C3H1-type domain-containing protein n=1 Tax=Effrenium voratum TaxID=2562239 RepID=A0AA36HJU0_9DINO|nr:unnamed protein product [Effrenium voratum]